MKNRYDLTIFDCDGTLIDSIEWIVKCLQISAIAVAGAHPETVLQQHQPLTCLQQPTELLNFI